MDISVRRDHVVEALRVARPWGYVLVALYYYHTAPPDEFVDEFNAKVGTKISPKETKTSWTDHFSNLPLTLEYEAEYDVIVGDEARTQQYIEQLSPETKNDWREYVRLFNENGRFLSYFVRVYRKVPNESSLMLQIPRGGIYGVRRKSGQNL